MWLKTTNSALKSNSNQSLSPNIKQNQPQTASKNGCFNDKNDLPVKAPIQSKADLSNENSNFSLNQNFEKKKLKRKTSAEDLYQKIEAKMNKLNNSNI